MISAIFGTDKLSGEGYACLGIDPISMGNAPIGERARVDISSFDNVPPLRRRFMQLITNNESIIMPSLYKVRINQHQNWHFATCEALPGLFVAHQHYDTVLKNIPEAIAMLIKHECNKDVTVIETQPTEPTLLGNKTYVVTTKLAA